MNRKMKKIAAIAVVAVLGAGVCHARPHGGGHRHGGPRPAPVVHRSAPPPAHHHHHGHSSWGHGGRNFWPGFVGGVVGGLLVDSVVTPPPVVVAPAPVVVTPPVVATPTYVTQNVWVEGRYIDQVQPNGIVVRVWQPGHYEQRQVLVQ